MKFEIPEEYKNASGIYCITNIINNKRLIGSTINFYRRFLDYNSRLATGKLTNPKLQNEYNKHGDNYKFELICLTTQENLEQLEDYYCRAFDTYVFKPFSSKKGYNLRPAERNKPISEEQKRKISEALTGRKRSPLSKELKKKLSASLKGRSVWNKGISCKKETKIKISMSRRGQNSWWKGKHHTNKSKKLMSNARKGRILSEEWKKKIKESCLKYHRNKS